MPLITLHTPKPGQGATVTAATLATLCATARQRTLLIDASTGDLPAELGLAAVQSPGLARYLTDPHAPTLDTLAVPVIENLDLFPLGEPDAMPATLDTGLVTGGCHRDHRRRHPTRHRMRHRGDVVACHPAVLFGVAPRDRHPATTMRCRAHQRTRTGPHRHRHRSRTRSPHHRHRPLRPGDQSSS